MKRLTEISENIESGRELSEEELRYLYEIEGTIEGFGQYKDPRKLSLLAGRNHKKDLALLLGCSEDRISTNAIEALSGDILFHYGDLDLTGKQNLKGKILPERVDGRIFLGDLRSLDGITLPKVINGNIDLSKIESAEGVDLSGVDGSIYLDSLKSAKGLKLPKTVNGRLSLKGLESLEGLTLPDIITGNLELGLQNKTYDGTKLPKQVDMFFVMGISEIKGELDLKEIRFGSGVYLPFLKSAKGLKLPKKINGDLHLMSLESIEGLELPDHIGGRLVLKSLKSIDGLKLPESIKGQLSVGLSEDELKVLRDKYPDIEIISGEDYDKKSSKNSKDGKIKTSPEDLIKNILEIISKK